MVASANFKDTRGFLIEKNQALMEKNTALEDLNEALKNQLAEHQQEAFSPSKFVGMCTFKDKLIVCSETNVYEMVDEKLIKIELKGDDNA